MQVYWSSLYVAGAICSALSGAFFVAIIVTLMCKKCCKSRPGAQGEHFSLGFMAVVTRLIEFQALTRQPLPIYHQHILEGPRAHNGVTSK